MKAFGSFILFCFSSAAFSQSHEVPSAVQLQQAFFQNNYQKQIFSNYTTGHEFCEKYKTVIAAENGFWVPVPVDYKDQNSQMTEVFAYWAEGFYSPSLPTMVYFDGGSGENSHGLHRMTKGFNELHFDQRGIACSRPATLQLYRNPHYYGSINVAKDAEAIREFLKINQWTGFGLSYGTIPATIYASLFPQHSVAVVLEGVISTFKSSDDRSVQVSQLNQLLSELPPSSLSAVTNYFADGDQSFAYYAQSLMYADDAFKILKDKILQLFPDTDRTDRAQADRLFGFRDVAAPTEFKMNDKANYWAISCTEGYEATQNSKKVVFKTKRKVPQFKTEAADYGAASACNLLGISANWKPYRASDFPVTVPVTYFQGSWDGATAPAGAWEHFNKVPTDQAQFISIQSGGHLSLWHILLMPGQDPALFDAVQNMTELAFHGQKIPVALLNQVNSLKQDTQWIMLGSR